MNYYSNKIHYQCMAFSLLNVMYRKTPVHFYTPDVWFDFYFCAKTQHTAVPTCWQGILRPVDHLLCSETGIKIVTMLHFFLSFVGFHKAAFLNWPKFDCTSHVRVNGPFMFMFWDSAHSGHPLALNETIKAHLLETLTKHLVNFDIFVCFGQLIWNMFDQI